MPMTRTIVELDLVGYSQVARQLQEHLDSAAVRRLNRQVQEFVDRGLDRVRLKRKDVVVNTAGDNAVRLLADAELAHHFAVAVHRATEAHNATRTLPSAHRWFRIGIATGKVSKRHGRAAGLPFIDAVRLETLGDGGHVLIDDTTYRALPDDLRSLYAGPQRVTDSKGQVHLIWRLVAVVVLDEYDECLQKVDRGCLAWGVHSSIRGPQRRRDEGLFPRTFEAATMSPFHLHVAARRLWGMLRRTRWMPDLLVAANEGALLTGAHLLEHLPVPLCTAATSPYRGSLRDVGYLSTPLGADSRRVERVLVLDAKLKRGASLRAVRGKLAELFPEADVRSGIVLAYHDQARFSVLDDEPPWLVTFDGTKCYVVFYTDWDPREDPIKETVRP